MKRLVLLTAILSSIFLLSACTLSGKPVEPPTPTFAFPSPAATLQPTATVEIPLPTAALPTLAPSPTAVPTPQAVLPIEASVAFDNYILRAGPGRLFERVAVYEPGSQVWVLGRCMGLDWVMVETSDHRAGWMNTAGLEYLGDFSSLPVYTYPGAVILRGHVRNADQSPAAGIGVAVLPAGSSDADMREDVTTGTDGTWYAYLPDNSRGEWQVQAVSYRCPTAAPEGECQSPGTFPPAQVITLPDALNVSIEMRILP